MRVSVIETDPGHATFRAMGGFGRVAAFLDGKRLRDCVTADSKTGWATVYERDAEDNLVLDSKRNAVKLKRLRGRIEIRRV